MFCPKCGTENPDNGKFCRSCGTDLGNVASALSGELQPPQAPYYFDDKGRRRSNNPDDIWSSSIKNFVSGIGFLIISIVLFSTNVAGGKNWWWAMLFPAFSMLASGVSQMVKVKRLEKRGNATPIQPNTLPINQTNTALPPIQTEFIKQQGSIYETADLVERPPSVIENTTKLLKIEEKE
jgi:zinc-ribbon domain